MNRNDSPWANAANALALLRPDKFASKPDNDAPQSTPSCQQAVNKERETEKGKSPHTPLKEKDKGKEFPPTPTPTPTPPARTHAQVKPDQSGSESESVGIRQVFRSGSAPRYTCPGISRNYILDETNDPVVVAMRALNIPHTNVWNGKEYNNAALMRWLIPQIGGEDVFRQLVLQQWRENCVDSTPKNYAGVFFAKLYKERDAMRGGVA